MNIYIIFGIVVLLLIIFGAVKYLLESKMDLIKLVGESDDYKHFVKRNYLMTIPERKFYDILTSVVGPKYHVVPQMVLSNVVSVNKYEKRKMKYRNKINRYVLDFVVFELPYFTPHLVVELDDTSHLLPERESGDSKVDAILEGVGVRVVHVKTAHEYDIEQISQFVLATGIPPNEQTHK